VPLALRQSDKSAGETLSSHGALRLNCLRDNVTRLSPGDIEANNHRHLARDVRRVVYRANVRLGKALGPA